MITLNGCIDDEAVVTRLEIDGKDVDVEWAYGRGTVFFVAIDDTVRLGPCSLKSVPFDKVHFSEISTEMYLQGPIYDWMNVKHAEVWMKWPGGSITLSGKCRIREMRLSSSSGEYYCDMVMKP